MWPADENSGPPLVQTLLVKCWLNRILKYIQSPLQATLTIEMLDVCKECLSFRSKYSRRWHFKTFLFWWKMGKTIKFCSTLNTFSCDKRAAQICCQIITTKNTCYQNYNSIYVISVRVCDCVSKYWSIFWLNRWFSSPSFTWVQFLSHGIRQILKVVIFFQAVCIFLGGTNICKKRCFTFTIMQLFLLNIILNIYMGFGGLTWPIKIKLIFVIYKHIKKRIYVIKPK